MKKLNSWIKLFMYPAPKTQKLLAVGLIILTIFMTLFVYVTGGIQYVYSHGMYIPILLAAIYFGLYGGLLQGFISGILLGPFMPIDTETMIMQSPINWLYRLFFFMLIGGVIGYFSTSVKRAYLERINLLKKDIYTDIPLFTNVLDQEIDNPSMVVMHLKILNHHDLIDLLGIDLYYRLLRELHKRTKTLESCYLYQKELSSFLITLKLSDSSEDEQIIERVIDCLKDIFIIEAIPVYIDGALGVTTSQSDMNTSLAQAMYASRYAEKNYLSYAYFKDTMIPDSENINILGLFKKALNNNELYLVFHPQFDLKTEKINSAEVLLRWQSDALGLMMPEDFIPLIEETSLINDLTEWVIKSTFERINMLQQSRMPCKISINISAKNLLNKTFSTNVIRWLDDYQVPSNLVEFEITEQSLMVNKSLTKTFIDRLKHEKISLSIDDFGTGYSSLSELNRYKVNTLKIDKQFIHRCSQKDQLCSIVKAAINLGKSLQIKTSAEGVETKEDLERLREMGCDYAQGFYYTKPLPFDKFYTYLKAHQNK